MLREGKLQVTQATGRLPVEGCGEVVLVGPAEPPGKPELLATFCEGIGKLAVSGLNPGATALIFGRVASDANWVVLRRGRVDSVAQSLSLPANYLPTPRPSQYRVEQQRCGVAGEPSAPVGTGSIASTKVAALFPPPIACADFVMVSGVALGGEIRLFDGNKLPIGDPTLVFANPQRVSTRPLHGGEIIGGECRYCDRTIAIAPVAVMTDTNGLTTELLPIKPGDLSVSFRDAVVGSRIELTRG
ncbi:MAG: hypothetical protein EON55_28015, partial [Alphaproteobacteria bacterium]